MKMIHITTGRPEYYLRLMKECKGMKKEISFESRTRDTRIWSKETFNQALQYCSTLFCNQNEMRAAMQYMQVDMPEKMLSSVPMIINTRGAKGSVLFSSEGSRLVTSACPSKIVDPTGAGDAFRAGYYAGRYHGFNTLESMAYGNSAASFILEAKGICDEYP